MIAALVFIVGRRMWQKRQAEAKQKQDGGDPS